MIKTDSKNIKLFVLFLTIFIAISPVLFYKYFPTVDGPAHLYNAKILRELLAGDREFYSRFFSFNDIPVPNWTGHIIAVIAGFILPLWMTEKLIILLIVCGFPLSLLYLARAYGAATSWHMLLVVPFIYTITLYLGFFNFMLALPLMFIFIAWLKSGKFSNDNKGLMLMITCLLLIYFSHLMVFLLTFIFSIIEILRSSFKGKISDILSKSFTHRIIAFMPGLLLAMWFFKGRGVEGFKKSVDVLPWSQLWQWILEGSPLVGLNGEQEVPASSTFMIGLFVLFLVISVFRIVRKSGWIPADLLLVFAGIMLLLYFIVPDGIASGGFVSLRFLLLFMVFITVWIITMKLPVIISFSAGILGICVSFYTLSYRHEVARTLNEEACNIVMVSDSMKKNSVLLPLNYSDNWLHINFSGYIGASGNIIVLDNYEAVLNEFPLKWNKTKEPFSYAGNFTQSLNPTVTIDEYEKHSGVKVDYVSRWLFRNDENDSLKISTEQMLTKKYGDPLRIEKCDLFGK